MQMSSAYFSRGWNILGAKFHQEEAKAGEGRDLSQELQKVGNWVLNIASFVLGSDYEASFCSLFLNTYVKINFNDSIMYMKSSQNPHFISEILPCIKGRMGQKLLKERCQRMVVKYNKSVSNTSIGLFFEPVLMK